VKDMRAVLAREEVEAISPNRARWLSATRCATTSTVFDARAIAELFTVTEGRR